MFEKTAKNSVENTVVFSKKCFRDLRADSVILSVSPSDRFSVSSLPPFALSVMSIMPLGGEREGGRDGVEGRREKVEGRRGGKRNGGRGMEEREREGRDVWGM